MSDVFLLGAGFSKAVSEEMPVTWELSREVLELCRKVNWQIEPAIQRMIQDNFEKALTFLSQPKPWLREAQNLRHRALYLDLTRAIRFIFRQKMTNPFVFGGVNAVPVWLQYLVHYWHKNRCHVISMNYDTLIECVAGVQGWKRDVGIPTGQLYPVTLTPASQRAGLGFPDQPLDTFKLYKLHGSINWFYSGAPDYFGENLYYVPCIGGAEGVFESFFYGEDAEKPHSSRLGDKVPLIIPPTLDKSVFFQHESLQSLWFQAGQALQKASRIICMGYSLPESDLAMAEFLKTCAPSSKVHFEIVNREQNRSGHFEKTIGKDAYDFGQDQMGDDSVPRFVLKHLAHEPDDQNYILRMTVWKQQGDAVDAD